jgi:DNA-binding PadR family transcriptional regulator
MISGYLKLMVLKQISQKECCGYELMLNLKQFSNQPSPGSIYPLLQDLHTAGLVKVRKEKKRKIYSLTSKGKKSVDILLREKEAIIQKHIELIRISEGIFNKKQMKELNELDHIINSREFISRHIEVLSEFKDLMLALSLQPENSCVHEKIEKILINAIKEFRKLKAK